jgi:hypothetical protein
VGKFKSVQISPRLLWAASRAAFKSAAARRRAWYIPSRLVSGHFCRDG